MKKYGFLPLFLSGVLCFTACTGVGADSSSLSGVDSSGGGTSSSSTGETGEKTLDLYVILGQSNALGISNISLLDEENADALNSSRAENIYFYGGGELNENKEKYTSLAFGQGQNTSRFGTEIGLGDYLSENGPTDNDTLIFKCAYGGTTLTNLKSGNSNKRWGGTWTPPSVEEISAEDRAGFACTYTLNGTEKTGYYAAGALYNKAISWLTEAVTVYEAEGYTISLNGTFWMQGETDAQNSVTAETYAEYLKALIGDLRADYAKLGILGAETSPFVIGKLAPTFNWSNEKTRAGVQTIRLAQDLTAADTAYTYTVETDEYIIVNPDGTIASGCHDIHHFGADDMVSLGRDVGAAFFMPRATITVEGNGSYTHEIVDGYDVLTIVPDEGYELFDVLVDGTSFVIDVLMGNNELSVARDRAREVKITFVAK